MKNLWMLIFLMGTLGSCTSEQFSEQDSLLFPLSLSGSSIGTKITAIKTSLNTVSTMVGVYVLQTDASQKSTLLTTPFTNKPYFVNENCEFSSPSSIELNNKFEYVALGYAPFKQITDVTAVPFSHGEDVLYAPHTAVTFTKTAASVLLPFVHKMSRITFKTVPGLHNPDVTGASLSVTGFYSSCNMNLNDGSVTPVMGQGAIITEADKANFIVPGTLNLDIKVTIGSRIYTLKESFTAEPSKDCIYTLKINAGSETSLSVDCRIVEWNEIPAGEIPDLQ